MASVASVTARARVTAVVPAATHLFHRPFHLLHRPFRLLQAESLANIQGAPLQYAIRVLANYYDVPAIKFLCRFYVHMSTLILYNVLLYTSDNDEELDAQFSRT